MRRLSHFFDLHLCRQVTRLKLVLFISFALLVLFQFLVGFNGLEDYLVIFIFVLFINDQYFKIKGTSKNFFQEERTTRVVMSAVFLVLFLLPFIFDSANVSNTARLTFYKLSFVLWAQILLIDSFIQYKQTQSKQWLVFANLAVLMVVVGAFVG